MTGLPVMIRHLPMPTKLRREGPSVLAVYLYKLGYLVCNLSLVSISSTEGK
jgi:hypothetical protein